ncbi:LacI family DNA-binding transcriptional regulator [Halothermothrix orenii]|uniref:Transcriptional regulator, LacI family n=1 Tax=Halothermothrix orenii (strain H 168 / OCM 544 / DSM 9562) TaxID=373903 RepID=B8CYK0_HALOH|nr:LacI family DNA-binding transcriptional regulator [Halothermothrix orenii]ACL70369.1 transcriptional regulator, LacI family [Halothermothrix orenii H 168]
MKNVTIKDVAKYADVSPSTVSRVISNSPSISPETQQRVREAMKKLGYHPNVIARSLVKQKTNTIGLVLSRPTKAAFANPFFPGIIQGIASVAQEEHFSLVLAAAKDYREEHAEALKMLRNRRVDGIILMASRVNDDLIKQLQDNRSKFILIGRSLEIKDIPLVNNDNIEAAYKAVKYLHKRGYEKVALICGPEEYVVSQDRLTGYKKALEEAGQGFDKSLVMYTNFTFEDGYDATKKLMAKKDFDAIFAVDDLLALGALRAAQDSGLKVPDDMGIVGFNDDPMVSYVKPALTTVRIPIVEMGEKAARMLIRIITEEDYNGEEQIIPTEILPRGSTR